jgi:excisionase family DNA binding protein
MTTADDLAQAAEACEEVLSRYYSGEGRLLLRLANAARALDTSVEVVRLWVRRGDLVAVRVGRALYISREDLLAFVQRHRGNPAPKRQAQPRDSAGRFNSED